MAFTQFQPLAPPPRFFRPTVGRCQRMYPSRGMAQRYELGWHHPERYTPAAVGDPEQQGALDRIDADRSAAYLAGACTPPQEGAPC